MLGNGNFCFAKRFTLYSVILLRFRGLGKIASPALQKLDGFPWNWSGLQQTSLLTVDATVWYPQDELWGADVQRPGELRWYYVLCNREV